MKSVCLVALVFAVGCSGSSPTAPTPPPVSVVPPVVTPPVVTPPVTPPTNPLLSDPRYSLSFYRMLALGEFQNGGNRPLARWSRAPLIYLRTVDDRGNAVDGRLLEQTAAAIINTASQWTGGHFGVAGLERGTGTRGGQPGWLTIQWSTSGVCGISNVLGAEGGAITMNHLRPECTCGPLVAKHELGHAMGFYHTNSDSDLMAASFQNVCDKTLSDREKFHAQVAYSQPVGSLDP